MPLARSLSMNKRITEDLPQRRMPVMTFITGVSA